MHDFRSGLATVCAHGCGTRPLSRNATIIILSDIHQGLSEIYDFRKVMKNAPIGASNPWAMRSSGPVRVTKSLTRNLLQQSIGLDGTVLADRRHSPCLGWGAKFNVYPFTASE